MSSVLKQEFTQDDAYMEVPKDPYAYPLDSLDPGFFRLFEDLSHLEFFKRLRAEDPVHYIANSPFGPYWSITKYDDIEAVDRNHDAFSSEGGIVIGEPQTEFNPPMFIAMDPPRHDIQRKVAEGSVKPRRLSDLEAEIREVAGRILDDLPEGEEFNWVEKVSRAMTQQMLGILFDVPEEDRHLLTYWSDITTTAPAEGVTDIDAHEREAILMQCLQYFMKLWQERSNQEDPSLDFISMLANHSETKDMIQNPMELMGNLMLLIVGGNDTTRNSISASVLAMHQYPEEFQKLKDNPELVELMPKEAIRWQTPLAHMRRTCVKDTIVGGKLIKEGDKVVMWFLSGNRDESKFERPNDFILDRDWKKPRHLSFGVGIHRCMGWRIGEMQVRVIWEEILKRFDRIEVTGDPVRMPSNFVRGYDELPTVVHRK